MIGSASNYVEPKINQWQCIIYIVMAFKSLKAERCPRYSYDSSPHCCCLHFMLFGLFGITTEPNTNLSTVYIKVTSISPRTSFSQYLLNLYRKLTECTRRLNKIQNFLVAWPAIFSRQKIYWVACYNGSEWNQSSIEATYFVMNTLENRHEFLRCCTEQTAADLYLAVEIEAAHDATSHKLAARFKNCCTGLHRTYIEECILAHLW